MPSLELGTTLLAEDVKEKKTVPRNNSGYLRPTTKSSKLKFNITTCNSKKLPLCSVDA
jgi:hypothetical protein